jgi:hypothetical protein
MLSIRDPTPVPLDSILVDLIFGFVLVLVTTLALVLVLVAIFALVRDSQKFVPVGNLRLDYRRQ